jgi:antitoxin MazE
LRSTIQKWGNSQAIRLPKAILKSANLTENESVQIFAENDRIIIQKDIEKKHKTIKERFAGYNGDYVFEEWDTGPAVGCEVIE